MTNDNNYVYNVNLKTPFYKSKKYVGIESKNCICIRHEEIKGLNSLYEDVIINFNIDFSVFSIKETRRITLKDLNNLLEKHRAILWTTFDDIEMVNIPRTSCELVS